MLIAKHTVKTKATAQQVWNIWQDVPHWKTWDEQLELSQIDGPFQAGTTGYTKFKNTPLLKTLLTEVIPNQLVVQETYLPLTKIVSYQSMIQKEDRTEITFQVEARGLLSFFYARMLRRSVRNKLPLEMEKMLKRAKAQEVS